VAGQPLAGWAAIGVVFGDIVEVLLAESAVLTQNSKRPRKHRVFRDAVIPSSA
jgi:hypothetical protein